ncbi:uncharacterized protein LOC123316816 [Coccinella septempunctata]|uniref:uncharacterized protein LOC123316816 n=2 Tax=Coccinella septempunctata TaxID=41139 RepID=UPI001D069AF8|nr:uncharacterized protein LOC123316816 [Coccinella septempunctata]
MSEKNENEKINARKKQIKANSGPITRNLSGKSRTDSVLPEVNSTIISKEVKTAGTTSDNVSDIMNEEVINEHNVRGQVQNLKEQQQDEYNEVFTPKKTVMRTPPEVKRTGDGHIAISGPSIGKIDMNLPLVSRDSENTENIIETILDALRNLNDFSEKEKLEKTDQEQLRKAVFKLHEKVTKLVYRFGKLETENRKENHPKSNILKPDEINRDTEIDREVYQENHSQIKTYSSILTTRKNTETTKTQKWKTPEKENKYEILINSNNREETCDIVKNVKLKFKELGKNETLKNIRHLQKGGVIFECYNDEQQKRIQEILKKQGSLQTKNIQNKDPMIMITGIKKGYQEDIFRKELIEDNPQMTEIFGPQVENSLKFIAKKM